MDKGDDAAPAPAGSVVFGISVHGNGGGPAGSGAIVRLEGELDLLTAPRLSRELTALAEGGCARVLVDMAGLAFIDSSGLHALVAGMRALQARNAVLEIRSPRPAVYRTMRIVGLTELLTVIDPPTG